MSPQGLDDALDALRGLAPPHLAASWDNTGLLVRGTRPVRRLGLCVDLTEAVLEELIGAEIDLVVAYHPPIFKGITRLTGATGLERVIARLLREGLHLYAPHTALDAAADGMGDWLARTVLPGLEVAPVEPTPLDPAVGMGRRGRFEAPTPTRTLLPGLRAALGVPSVRVAGDLDAPRHTFAVCPGAGGSLFADLHDVDLFLTGEMRHHDVLAKVAAGSVVILTDHTNTERGFLPKFAARLGALLPGTEVLVSAVDRDPLTVM